MRCLSKVEIFERKANVQCSNCDELNSTRHKPFFVDEQENDEEPPTRFYHREVVFQSAYSKLKFNDKLIDQYGSNDAKRKKKKTMFIYFRIKYIILLEI